jgi:ribosome-associated translation inhibitor RaiA
MELGDVTKTRATIQVARRRSSSLASAHLRVLGVELDQDERSHLRRRLAMKLRKCAPSIERVSIRVADVNGPRGGVDQVCRINVVLVGLPPVVVEERDASLETAIDGAITRTERAVRRSVQRRRMKPIRDRHNRRSSGSGVPRTAK